MQKVDERFLIHCHTHGFYLTPRQLTEIYAYYDYEKYRRLLNDKNACKVVPPFNPLELAALCPVVERVIAVDVERAG